MIDLHYCATPNGHKITMCLEELGLAYRKIPVSLSKGDQFKPEFLAISPNNKIPAIVDHAPHGEANGAPFALFESGVILLYLAEKAGRLMPTQAAQRFEAMAWLFWQVSGLGPMAGQIGHFNVYAPEKVPYAISRYTNETRRLYGVLDRRLAEREFICGDYSIVDIACYPWIVPHKAHGQRLSDFKHLQRWFDAIAARPATVRAYGESADVYAPTRTLTDTERGVLFGINATGTAA